MGNGGGGNGINNGMPRKRRHRSIIENKWQRRRRTKMASLSAKSRAWLTA